MTTRPGPNRNSVYGLLEAAPTPILVVRPDGVIDYCNAAAQACFGYSREDLFGLKVAVLVPDDQLLRHGELRAEFDLHPSERAMRGGREFVAKRKDGSIFPIEASLIPVGTEHGGWVLVSAVDITERLAAQKRLSDLSHAYLTLVQMNQATIRAPHESALFSDTCRIAVEQGGYAGAWVGKRGAGSSVVCVAMAGVVEDFVDEIVVTTDPDDACGQGPAGQVLRGGPSHYVDDFANSELAGPWRELGARFGIKAAATLPVRCAGKTVATLILYSAVPHVFDEEVRALLESMADNISFALDGFEALAQLRELARQRKDLSARLVAAQEAERARIAADVHDDSVQALAAISLRLGLLRNQLAEVSPEAAGTAAQLLTSVVEVNAGLRDLLFKLEPAEEGVSLIEMVERAAAHIFEDGRIAYSITVDEEQWDRHSSLSPTDRGQTVRILKEALLNAREHASASEVIVSITPGPDGVTVKVADNGVGFDDDMRAAPGHRGLANMVDRASVSGGTCEIASGGGGTVVQLWMPYDGLDTRSVCSRRTAG